MTQYSIIFIQEKTQDILVFCDTHEYCDVARIGHGRVLTSLTLQAAQRRAHAADALS